MRTKRRVEIEVVTERLSIRRNTSAAHTLCPFCEEAVEMVAAETAALLCGRTLRWMVNQVETGGLHFVETADGLLYICLGSLTASVSSQASRAGSVCEMDAPASGERFNI